MMRFLLALMFSFCTVLCAQTVTTVLPPGSQVDDYISRGPDGDFYISHYDGTTIWKVSLTGTRTSWQSGIIRPNGSTFAPNGDFFYTANQGRGVYRKVGMQNGSAYGPAINRSSGVLFDPYSDTLLVTSYADDVIYKLPPDGNISPFVSGGELNGPVGLQVDENGVYYVGNFDDRKILRLERDGSLSLVAQIPGGWLGFIAYANQQIFATSFNRHEIYRVNLNGTYEVLAGIANTAGSQDGPVSVATFNNPNGVFATADGDTVLITDYGSKSLRMITGVATSINADFPRQSGGYQLKANYPNPFNPQTTIEFILPVATDVQLEIFDTIGRHVETLHASSLPAGPHKFVWNATTDEGNFMPGGVYFYRLQTPAFSETRKMLLIQ